MYLKNNFDFGGILYVNATLNEVESQALKYLIYFHFKSNDFMYLLIPNEGSRKLFPIPDLKH